MLKMKLQRKVSRKMDIFVRSAEASIVNCRWSAKFVVNFSPKPQKRFYSIYILSVFDV